ncbi:MAG: hypothetical protein LC792_19805 [Actinobacteria bacterium]|nr:hypothetical protein [Actinomycetota bacterium]
MHDFAVILLLGLGLFKLVDLLEDYVPAITKVHALATMALAVGTVWLLDYSLFDGFGIGVRDAWMGPVFTGLMVGGSTSCWRALFHWLGSDEGDAPEVRHHVMKAA